MTLSNAIASTRPAAADADLDALLADPRTLFRLRVRRAARRALQDKGLRVSMDEIADAAGVGRRSLFRYFDSRDTLIAEALAEALDEYHASVATETDPQPSDLRLEQWLESLATRFHQAVTDGGLAYWQLAAAGDDDLPAELAALNRRRRAARKTSTTAIARQAWRRAGGRGATPKIVVDAVALTFSAFTTRSMLEDYGATATTVARTSAAMLSRLIENEVATRSHANRTTE